MNETTLKTVIYSSWPAMIIILTILVSLFFLKYIIQKKDIISFFLFFAWICVSLLNFWCYEKTQQNCTFDHNTIVTDVTLMKFGLMRLNVSYPSTLRANPKSEFVFCSLKGFNIGYRWNNPCCHIKRIIKNGKNYDLLWVHGDLKWKLMGITILKRSHSPSILIPR